MKFADLRTGDWFEWDKRIYIRLKNMIMSLDKSDFGTLYAPLFAEREVKYITAFDYDATAELDRFKKITDLNADEAPFNMLLKSSQGNFYVKISPYNPGDRDMIAVNTVSDNQGRLVHSKYFINRLDVVDKMRVNLFEGEL